MDYRQNPQLQREAIWKSRTHLTESTNLSLRKLALDAKAPLPLRLEATAALGNSESPDTGTLVEILKLKTHNFKPNPCAASWAPITRQTQRPR